MKQPKFLVDENLWGLLRWLRMMGVDSHAVAGASDEALLAIAQQQTRVVLTKDRQFFSKIPIGHAYFVEAQKPREQLLEVLRVYSSLQTEPLSRCFLCNTLIVPVDREAVRGRVEERTLRFYNRFYECPTCHQIYWEGSHFFKLQDEVESVKRSLVKTIYYCASTVNGFIADANNSLNWLFQFGHGGEDHIEGFMSQVGALVMGSTTYQWLYDHEISKKEIKSEAWPYKMPAWVFSKRRSELPVIPDVDIRFVQGDVKPVHRAMKEAAQGKNLWIVGGGELAGQFYDAGLLDELVITMAPTFLAGGAPLFPRTTQPPLKLLSVQKLGEAFVELRYEVPRGSREK